MTITTSERFGHTLEFHEGCECHGQRAHLYLLDGRLIPGASDIKKAYPISQALMQYQIKQGIEEFKTGTKLKRVAAIGTWMHDYCHALRLGLPFDKSRIKGLPDEEQIARRFSEVEAWCAERAEVEDVIAAEQIIASVRHDFGGKFDCVVRRKVDGLLVLQDYKSAKGHFVDQFIQEGIYDVALREWLGLEVDAYEVIRFNDNTDRPAPHLIEGQEALAAFRAEGLRLRETRTFQGVWETYFNEKYAKGRGYE